MDITEFVKARLDEDEAAAKAAGGTWDARTLGGDLGPGISEGPGVFVRGAQPTGRLATTNTRPLADYMARHDPARALREVAAKRKILWAHPPKQSGRRMVCSHCHYGNVLGANWPCLTMTSLAGIWSDHPDFQPEWTP